MNDFIAFDLISFQIRLMWKYDLGYFFLTVAPEGYLD